MDGASTNAARHHRHPHCFDTTEPQGLYALASRQDLLLRAESLLVFPHCQRANVPSSMFPASGSLDKTLRSTEKGQMDSTVKDNLDDTPPSCAMWWANVL